MTEKEVAFRNSPQLREQLAELLKNEVLKMALDAIRIVPTELPPPLPGQHQDLIMAREYSKLVGINNAISKLTTLTKSISQIDEKQAARDQWADYLPEDMRKAIQPEQP